MRVDSYASSATSEVSNVATKDSSAQASGLNTLANGPEDRTTLMSGSDSISSLTAQTMQMGAARNEKVQSLQQAVSSGDYTVDPAKIAEAMVSGSV